MIVSRNKEHCLVPLRHSSLSSDTTLHGQFLNITNCITRSLSHYRMGSHRNMEGEHEFLLLFGQPMTSQIRGDLHLMAGRLILRFNFSKLFFVTNSFSNNWRVWLGSGDNGKWTIAHLTPILKMKPYFWFVFGTWDLFSLMTSHFTAAQ